jgi:hypothetical protein
MAKDIDVFISHLIFFSSENCLFNSFTHLLIELFVLQLFSFLSSLYFLEVNPLFVELMAKILPCSVHCLLCLVTVSFDVQKLFNSLLSYLSILFIFPEQLESYSENNYLYLYLPDFSLFFSCISVNISDLTLRSLTI